MKQKLYLLIVCFLMIFAFSHAKAEETTESSFIWQENADGTITVTGWNGEKVTSLEIPEEIGGKKVTHVTAEVVKACNNTLEKLVLPSTVIDFGGYPDKGYISTVFGNKLKNIEVSENNQVFASLDGALYTKDLTKLLYVPKAYEGILVLPDTLIEIDFYALQSCGYISEIVIPADVKVLVGRHFEGCRSLEKFTVSENNKNYFVYEGMLYAYYAEEKRLISVPAKKS